MTIIKRYTIIFLILTSFVDFAYGIKSDWEENQHQSSSNKILLKELEIIDTTFQKVYLDYMLDNRNNCFDYNQYIIKCFKTDTLEKKCILLIEKIIEEQMLKEGIKVYHNGHTDYPSIKYFFTYRGVNFMITNEFFPSWIFKTTDNKRFIEIKAFADRLTLDNCISYSFILYCHKKNKEDENNSYQIIEDSCCK